MKIDSHQHFWKYNPSEYDWIPEDVIRKDFLPNDLLPILKANDFDGCVAVQARQSEEETEWLLKLADENDFIKGVVGWIDLRAKNLEERIEHFKKFPKLKAYRHVVQGESDDRFIVRPEFTHGIEILQKHHIPYDILIYPKHLEVSLQFIKIFPEHDFVIDHIAKPEIANDGFEYWQKHMMPFKDFPNVRCKLSGMVTETNFNNWQAEDFHPYLESCLEIFGPERLMIGSDWPVCLLSGQYKEVMDIVKSYISKLSQTEQELILGKTAATFYRL
ncbi:MAG: amidohydrolase family protein [Lentisphaeraceae bacterium]|nr:amidohydrolase family protein [Lentisphaeraceae bacterium]